MVKAINVGEPVRITGCLSKMHNDTTGVLFHKPFYEWAYHIVELEDGSVCVTKKITNP